MAAALTAAGCHADNGKCPTTLPQCPATMPVNGAPCAGISVGGGCEYGDDPWPGCDVMAICGGSEGWVVEQPPASCQPSAPAGCAATFADAMAGAACPSSATTALNCRYPEGMCSCQPGQAAFTCTPPAAAGCPAARPHSGTPCGPPCTTWGSGTCDGQSMTCACGVWQPVECDL